MHGGLFSNNISEIFGGPGSGKTALCYQIALATLGNTIDDVLYIDSGTSFSYHKLTALFEVVNKIELNKMQFRKMG